MVVSENRKGEKKEPPSFPPLSLFPPPRSTTPLGNSRHLLSWVVVATDLKENRYPSNPGENGALFLGYGLVKGASRDKKIGG